MNAPPRSGPKTRPNAITACASPARSSGKRERDARSANAAGIPMKKKMPQTIRRRRRRRHVDARHQQSEAGDAGEPHPSRAARPLHFAAGIATSCVRAEQQRHDERRQVRCRSVPIAAAYTNTDEPPSVTNVSATSIACEPRVAAWRVRCGRNRSTRGTSPTNASGDAESTAMATNSHWYPTPPRTAVINGGRTTPMSGPTTATSRGLLGVAERSLPGEPGSESERQPAAEAGHRQHAQCRSNG